MRRRSEIVDIGIIYVLYRRGPTRTGATVRNQFLVILFYYVETRISSYFKVSLTVSYSVAIIYAACYVLSTDIYILLSS